MKLTIPFLPRNSSFDFIKNNYRIIEYVGKGQFGNTYKVENIIDNKIWLAKCIDLSQMDEDDKKRSLQEAEIMKNINNPYVIKCHESFIHDDIYLVIIMEYCNNGDIGKVIESCILRKEYLSEEIILKWSSQLIAGIYYLHSECKIIHRDIKPSNIFIRDNGDVVIGDFGISRIMKSMSVSFTLTSIGTPQYMSPEMCENKPYTYKSDIWSFGCVLYELTALKPPFSGDSLLSLAWNISFQDIEPLPNCFSKELFKLIKKLLSRNPKVRPNPDQILDDSLFHKYKNSLLYLPLEKNNEKIEIRKDYIKQKCSDTKNKKEYIDLIKPKMIFNNNTNYYYHDFKTINGTIRKVKKHYYSIKMDNHSRMNDFKIKIEGLTISKMNEIKKKMRNLYNSKYDKTKTFSYLLSSNFLKETQFDKFNNKYINNDNKIFDEISNFYYHYFVIIVARVQYKIFNYVEKLNKLTKGVQINKLLVQNLKCCYGIDFKKETVTINWFSKFVEELNLDISETEQLLFLTYIGHIIRSNNIRNNKNKAVNNTIDNETEYENSFLNSDYCVKCLELFENNGITGISNIVNCENINIESLILLNNLKLPKIHDFIYKLLIWNKIKVKNTENPIIKEILSLTTSKISNKQTNSMTYNNKYLYLFITDWIKFILKPIITLNITNKSKINSKNIKNITLREGLYFFDEKSNGILSRQHFKTALYLLFPKLTTVKLNWLFALAPKDYFGNVVYHKFLNFIDDITNLEYKTSEILVEHNLNIGNEYGLSKYGTFNFKKLFDKYCLNNNINSEETIPGTMHLYDEALNGICIGFDDPILRIKERINFNFNKNENSFFDDDLQCNIKDNIFLCATQDILLFNNNKNNKKPYKSQKLLHKTTLLNYNNSLNINDNKFMNFQLSKTIELNKNKLISENKSFYNLMTSHEKTNTMKKLFEMNYLALSIKNIKQFYLKQKVDFFKFNVILSKSHYHLILIIVNHLEKLIKSIQIERLYTCWTTAKASKNKTIFNKILGRLKEIRNNSSDTLIKLIFYLDLSEKENIENQELRHYFSQIYKLKIVLIKLKNNLTLQREAIDCIMKITDRMKTTLNIENNDENNIHKINISCESDFKKIGNFKNIFKQLINNKTEFTMSNKKYDFKYDNLIKNKEFNNLNSPKINNNIISEMNSCEKEFDWIGIFLASFEFFSETTIDLIQYSINIISMLNKKGNEFEKDPYKNYLIKKYKEWSYLKEHVSRECAFVASIEVNKDSNRDLETIRIFLELLGARRYQLTVSLQEQSKIEKKLFRELHVLEELLWHSQKQKLLKENKVIEEYKFNNEDWLFIGEKTCMELHNTCIKLINDIITFNEQ
ncbi:NIMA-related kinase 5 [Cryptosporidium ryanae]|uniref:NIMA-related kinase 5 n=1 Tax=Cryptosporidium ryanae TaxID=515981 RepID=UPI00351A4B2A|nr:NIMA-related kinase 5 [Cryptosporidium ryanae]